MNTLSLWEPLRDGLTLRDAVNRLFEDSIVRPETMTRTLPMDVLENADGFTVKMSIPGGNKDDIDLNFQKDTLTVKAHIGEAKATESEVVKGAERYLLRERFNGEVSRSVTFPVPVDVEKAKAQFKDGVLLLSLPKSEAVRPRSIKVSE